MSIIGTDNRRNIINTCWTLCIPHCTEYTIHRRHGSRAPSIQQAWSVLVCELSKVTLNTDSFTGISTSLNPVLAHNVQWPSQTSKRAVTAKHKLSGQPATMRVVCWKWRATYSWVWSNLKNWKTLWLTQPAADCCETHVNKADAMLDTTSDAALTSHGILHAGMPVCSWLFRAFLAWAGLSTLHAWQKCHQRMLSW